MSQLDHRQFLPQGTLEILLDSMGTSVLAMMDQSKPHEVDSDSLLDYILQGPGARKVFATLVLSGFEGRRLRTAISQFREINFSDSNLPITEKTISLVPFFGTDNRPPAKPWNMVRTLNFREHQWKFLAPVFQESVHELTLQSHHVLPFTYTSKNISEGAFSEVRQVTIHPRHMVIRNIASRDQLVTLALKDIKQISPEDDNEVNTAEEWKREINAHISISKLRHPHIVGLVAAIYRDQKRYMLMEWADGGNLQQFWERNKSPRLSATLVRDVVIQLRGLVDGLEALHNHERGSYRHGDLKPENILQFRDRYKEETGTGADVYLGILKIADMGLAKQHKVSTRLRQGTNTRYGTYRYEPPEVIFRKTHNCGLSRRYDIWSLGCICVELLIWLLYGSNGLHSFNEYLDGTPGEFFTYSRVNNGKAVLHPRVESLLDEIVRNDRECREQSAIRDLLAVIRTQMLVVDLGTDPAPVDAADSTANSTVPVISVTIDRSRSRVEKLGNYRATAREVRNALDNILAKGNATGRYWYTGSTRDNPSLQLPALTFTNPA